MIAHSPTSLPVCSYVLPHSIRCLCLICGSCTLRLCCVDVTAQFGPGKLPQHGFARNKLWRHGETSINKATGDITTAFHLNSDADTLKVWPHQFELVQTVVLKATSLSQQLTINNTGSESFECSALFHTYFHVDNILTTQVSATRSHNTTRPYIYTAHKFSTQTRQSDTPLTDCRCVSLLCCCCVLVLISFGLRGLTYLDKTIGGQRVEETNDPIVFRGEVDRVYIGGGSRELRLADDGNAELIIKMTGFKDVVVWNPHVERAKSMPDLGEENYTKFVCVEAASVNEMITVEAGGKWEAAQGLSLRIKDEASSSK